MNEQLIGDLFAEATRRMTGSSSKELSQKFAELIVEECANLFDKDEMELSLTERTIYKTIKEHFGIEK